MAHLVDLGYCGGGGGGSGHCGDAHPVLLQLLQMPVLL
jgi:hypothetical protein